MKTMSARTGFGMNAHTIYVDALARQAGLLAGTGRIPAPAPMAQPPAAMILPPKPPMAIPSPPKPAAHVSVPQRRPAYLPAPVRRVPSEFFEDS